jgi:hypothetical protein
MNKLKFISFDYIKALLLIFIFVISFYLLISPQEVFAMEPSDLWTTNYYRGKEYLGPNAYAYFHPDPAPNIDTIQSSVSKPYGTYIKDDWYEKIGPQISQSIPNINELDSKPLYELDGKPIYKSINPSYDRDELHLWTPGQSITKNPYSNPVRYYFEPKHTTFELDTDSIEGTISTNVNSVTWHRRNHNNMEIIRDYCNYVDNFSKNKKGIFTKISLCIETSKNNIIFIYLKCNEVGKRKILWTIWERNRSKYDSYKEFKRSWDSNTSIWSSIKKDIKEEIRAEVEDLLGVKKIKKDIKKSVRGEVEKLLRERQPFRS